MVYGTSELLRSNAELIQKLAKLGSFTEVEQGQGVKLPSRDFAVWIDIDEETCKQVGEQLANKLTAEQGTIKNLEARLGK